ncbi:MAG TPA: hypothetical protein VKX28_07730 [Xanthobacteraceae bacterium]|nr:hypothetical protein [Xanthobacteraceae bacterium]
MADKAQKARFNLLGYGAIAVYIGLLAMVAAGVYGFNMTRMMMLFRGSELTREQMRTGHMVITTEDQTQCRSIHFDNQTSELGAETLADCDAVQAQEHSGGGTFGVFRHSFTGR